MSNNTSRFAKYKSDDLPQLFKPQEGDNRVGRLAGIREHTATNERDGKKVEVIIPVLDLVDLESGEEWSFMSGAWPWLDELDVKDPQDGDVIRISRDRDIGMSRDYRLEVLESAEKVTAPSDNAKGADDADIPF
jgi:hypothetical protein